MGAIDQTRPAEGVPTPTPPLKGRGLDRPALVAHAKDSIAKGSRSFALASRLFDRETRERAWLLYAWCRKCDDLADGQDHGRGMSVIDDAADRLGYLKGMTDAAWNGTVTGEPAFDGFGVVARECGIPRRFADDVIAGFALDTEEWRPRSENDLYRYCYHVAGAVGCMMAVVMGVDADDEATLDRACDLGLAFQLANIARDLAEDDAAGRCYLPMEWLAEFDIPPGQHLKPPFRPALVAMAKRLADASERYEASARVGAEALPLRSRWAVLAAAGIYGDIAREVRARGAHAWDHRVHTGKREKLLWVARARAQAGASVEPVGREGLWNRNSLSQTSSFRA